ncbi:MAG: glucokinase, partial [Gammaproteobacteria bacterium]|nr:glucokinase [Gammaproteobacteria bacterium]
MADLFLIADVGATHSRFALADGELFVSDVLRLATSEHDDAESLIAAARDGLGFGVLDGCCIAMAGPVENGHGAITNATLALDCDDLSDRLGCPSVVVNDFFALAHAVPDLKRLQQVGGDTHADGVRALLGPGSGLGMSVLIAPVPVDGPVLVLPSEGGHADLAPASPLELEVLQILGDRLPHVTWESVLSGPGLV